MSEGAPGRPTRFPTAGSKCPQHCFHVQGQNAIRLPANWTIRPVLAQQAASPSAPSRVRRARSTQHTTCQDRLSLSFIEEALKCARSVSDWLPGALLGRTRNNSHSLQFLNSLLQRRFALDRPHLCNRFAAMSDRDGFAFAYPFQELAQPRLGFIRRVCLCHMTSQSSLIHGGRSTSFLR